MCESLEMTESDYSARLEFFGKPVTVKSVTKQQVFGVPEPSSSVKELFDTEGLRFYDQGEREFREAGPLSDEKSVTALAFLQLERPRFTHCGRQWMAALLGGRGHFYYRQLPLCIFSK